MPDPLYPDESKHNYQIKSSSTGLLALLAYGCNCYAQDYRYRQEGSLADELYRRYTINPNVDDTPSITSNEYEHSVESLGDSRSSGGFRFVSTHRGGDSWFRVVLHVNPAYLGHVTSKLSIWMQNRDSCILKFKFPDSPDGMCARLDNLIVYLGKIDDQHTYEVVRSATQDLAVNLAKLAQHNMFIRLFLPKLPPIVEEIYPGVGWAEQTPAESRDRDGYPSFGEYRCQILAQAIVRRVGNLGALMEGWKAFWNDAHLSCTHPHRNRPDEHRWL